MAVREFVDGRGTRWRAWDVRPTPRDRRSGRDRRAGAQPDSRLARPPRGPDRRVRDLGRPAGVSAALAGGWLCFEAHGSGEAVVRRRLAPIPSGWETCSEAALRAHLERAAPGSPASRSA